MNATQAAHDAYLADRIRKLDTAIAKYAAALEVEFDQHIADTLRELRARRQAIA